MPSRKVSAGASAPSSATLLAAAGASKGDRVRVTAADGATFEGLLLPTTSSSAPDVAILKLASGYNMGVRLGPSSRVEVLAKAAPEKQTARSMPRHDGKPRIALLGTGGTIASYVDYRTGAVFPAKSASDLAFANPELLSLCDVDAEVVFELFSEDLQPPHWQELAVRVAKALNGGAKGVVIPHGTDTLSYTAAALSFFLKDLSGPVVLVGAQRSSDRPSSDASMNLLAAARVAATTDLGEVVVVMHGGSSDEECLIHRGTRVRKMHTSRRDAFRSVNAPPLGRVTADRVALERPYRKATKGPVVADTALDEDVSMIQSYPGLSPEHITDVVRKGTILVGTGLGHVARRCLPAVKEVIGRGAFVVMASQCLWGRVNMRVYSTGRDLIDLGVLDGGDTLPETSYIKLMWILGHTTDPAEVRRLVASDLVGERGGRTEFESFLA